MTTLSCGEAFLFLLRIDKGSSVPEPRTSNIEHREGMQQDQPTDQWLPDNDTGVWTADVGKILCKGQQG